MPIIFLITLIFFMWAYLLISKFNVWSASFTMLAVFFLTSLSSIYFYINYNYSFSIETYFILLSSIALFVYAEFIGVGILGNNDKLDIDRYFNDFSFKTPFYLLLLMLFIFIITIYLRYQHLVSSGGLFSGSTDFFVLVQKSRICSVFPEKCTEVGVPFLLKIGTILSKAFAYILVLEYLVNKRSTKIRPTTHGFIYFIFIFGFCIQLLLSTARTGFIYFIVYIFFCWAIIFMVSSPNRKEIVIKLFRKAGFTLISFSVVFYFLGFFTSKSEDFSIFEMLGKYTGLQFYTLNSFIMDNGCNGSCASRGDETFYAVRRFLFRLGLVNDPMQANLPYASLGEFSTNIYTGFRRYVADFGLLINSLLCILMGLFYGMSYQFLTRKTFFPIGIAFYAALLYPVFMMPWEERFSNVLISNQTVIQFIFMYVFYKLASRKLKDSELNVIC
jgi:oligosaccharide repeat unit polymerase